MHNAQTLDYYTIFCGVFLYDNRKSGNTVPEWTERIPNSRSFHDYLRQTYYQNYLSNIFTPGKDRDTYRLISHQTSQAQPGNPLKCKIAPDSEVDIFIPYFDSYQFASGIGIFSFKIQLQNPDHISYLTISQIIGKIRQPLTQVSAGGNITTVQELIKAQLEQSYDLHTDWNRYVNQLKSYTIINDPNEKRFTSSLDNTLFEISHVMSVGTISSGSKDSPTASYFESVMAANSISVYENWKAVSLLDSFTRISCDYPDRFQSWEFDYLHIYIYCIYCKFQLYYFNNQLTDLLQINRSSKKVRDNFVSFASDYSLPYISYRFLPNMLYERMSSALEIQKELAAMERKIERLNEGYQNKKSRQLSMLLLVISVLSLASVVNDISQWLTSMGAPSSWVYNPLSILVGASVLAISGWYIVRKT
jgi:hypothetical protein